MPMIKNVVGLDLGSYSTKIVEIRQTLRGLEPVQAIQALNQSGQVIDADALGALTREKAISLDQVTCALPGDRISLRRLEFPFRDRKRLNAAVPFEIETNIPFELDDVLIDWQVLDGERSKGVVVAAIAQRADVAQLLELTDQAGCPPRILEAEGLALANLAPLFELSGLRILVDLGHRKTSLCLMHEGRPLTARTIPTAGLALTKALARDTGLSMEMAEERKCRQGLLSSEGASPSGTFLDQLDRIAREIVRTIESHDLELDGHALGRVEEITLMGGSAYLEGIEGFLSERTGLPARRLPLPDAPEAAALFADCDPVIFGPALALCLRTTARATTRVDFRQDEFSYRSDLGWMLGPEFRSTFIMAGIFAVMLALSFIGSIVVESRKAEQLEDQARSMYLELFPGQPEPERPMAALGLAVTQAQERADFLGLYGGNLSALDLMTRLSALIPADLKLKFDEIAIDPKVIRIKVTTDSYESMDRLENELRTEPHFASVDVAGQAKRQRDGSVTFSLNIPLQTPGEDS
ncbi:pilus assembly protein PilM [Myxococcota bacterium]|nr:pilus assembly protein PilM [Myxococcota bacterium]